MLRTIVALVNDDAGQGLAEYGLILGLIAVVCIGALSTMGTQLSGMLGNVASDI
jgi:pilus assembly protein Flp/PilA